MVVTALRGSILAGLAAIVAVGCSGGLVDADAAVPAASYRSAAGPPSTSPT